MRRNGGEARTIPKAERSSNQQGCKHKVVLVFGIGFLVAAALAGTDAWTEFFQYFRESKFIHVMSVDFLTLSSLAPVWVYNDMATRKWLDKSLWVLPLSLIPYIGPALYLVLRPPFPSSMLEEETGEFSDSQ